LTTDTQDLNEAADESVTWRLSQAAEARNEAVRSVTHDDVEYQEADNGVDLSKEDLQYAKESHAKINFTRRTKR